MDTLSVLSTIIAVIAAIISVITFYETRKIAKIQTNLELVNKGNEMIIQHPDLLALHGITETRLKECSVSIQEFLYILNSFYAGQAYHSIDGTKKVVLSVYRKRMLDNEKVRTSWVHFIRQHMIAPTPYAKAIDEYYNLK